MILFSKKIKWSIPPPPLNSCLASSGRIQRHNVTKTGQRKKKKKIKRNPQSLFQSVPWQEFLLQGTARRATFLPHDTCKAYILCVIEVIMHTSPVDLGQGKGGEGGGRDNWAEQQLFWAVSESCALPGWLGSSRDILRGLGTLPLPPNQARNSIPKGRNGMLPLSYWGPNNPHKHVSRIIWFPVGQQHSVLRGLGMECCCHPTIRGSGKVGGAGVGTAEIWEGDIYTNMWHWNQGNREWGNTIYLVAWIQRIVV